MRAIHVIPHIGQEASGPTYSVVRLCQELAGRGLGVELAAIAQPGAPNPLPALARTFPPSPGPARLACSAGMRRWLGRETSAGGVDIVHNHSFWMMPNLYSGWAARKPGVALVVSPHGTLSPQALAVSRRAKRLFWPLLQRPAIAHASCFHATAAHELADIRRMGLTQPVAVIPNGIDLPPPAEPSIPAEKTLLFLGRLHPIKGLDLLLRAWTTAGREHPDWRLVIAGPSEQGHGDELRRLAGELACERVEFPGPVYGADKLALYRRAALAILPSRSENFGIAVAEALAAGTPCVATAATPWRGLDPQGAGWCVPVDAEALAAALSTAMALPLENLKAMGLKGRGWMAEEYSWERIGTLMETTYRWLKRGGTAPAWMDIAA